MRILRKLYCRIAGCREVLGPVYAGSLYLEIPTVCTRCYKGRSYWAKYSEPLLWFETYTGSEPAPELNKRLHLHWNGFQAERNAEIRSEW